MARSRGEEIIHASESYSFFKSGNVMGRRESGTKPFRLKPSSARVTIGCNAGSGKLYHVWTSEIGERNEAIEPGEYEQLCNQDIYNATHIGITGR